MTPLRRTLDVGCLFGQVLRQRGFRSRVFQGASVLCEGVSKLFRPREIIEGKGKGRVGKREGKG